jgi:hypothetical protein
MPYPHVQLLGFAGRTTLPALSFVGLDGARRYPAQPAARWRRAPWPASSSLELIEAL